MTFTSFRLLLVLLGAASAAKMAKNLRVLSTEISAAGEPQQALLSLVASAAHATEGSLPDVDSLTSLAKSLKGLKADDPTVAQIRTLVDGMLQALTEQHNTLQTGLQNFSLFTACTAQKDEDLQNAQNLDIVGNYTNTTELYAQCLHELGLLNQTWQSCLSQKVDLLEAKDAFCALYAEVDKGDNYQSWFCSEDSMDNTASYKSYLQRNIDMLYEYERRKANCTTATNNHNDKVTECAALATPVSDKVVVCAGLKPGTVPANCGPNQASIAACNTYDNCWASAENAAEQAFNTAEELEASLMAEWRALKRIECLLDVLAIQDGQAQTNKLEECIATTHSAAALDIVEPTYPTQDTCTIFPCGNETSTGTEEDANTADDDPTR